MGASGGHLGRDKPGVLGPPLTCPQSGGPKGGEAGEGRAGRGKQRGHEPWSQCREAADLGAWHSVFLKLSKPQPTCQLARSLSGQEGQASHRGEERGALHTSAASGRCRDTGGGVRAPQRRRRRGGRGPCPVGAQAALQVQPRPRAHPHSTATGARRGRAQKSLEFLITVTTAMSNGRSAFTGASHRGLLESSLRSPLKKGFLSRNYN